MEGADCLDENAAEAFAQGAGDETTRARVELHIDTCAVCRVLVAALARGRAAPAPPPQAAGDLDARFDLTALLGAGATGIVYRAVDRASGAEVALKVLRRPEAGHLLALKREFRALADLAHPNIAALYELLSLGETWFFTMELVRGCGIGDYVIGAPPVGAPPVPGLAPGASTLLTVAGALQDDPTIGVQAPRRSLPQPRTPAQLDRLRRALVQLVRAIDEVHRHGRLHGDIKPANVMVEPEGRLVLLDFGLSIVQGRDAGRGGTLAYMAPEQVTGGPTPASDLYAVGVTLYELLCGELPFGATEMWARKQAVPPLPALRSPALPADLAALCVRLLSPTPVDRPSASEVLRELESRTGSAVDPRPEGIFVGRERELAALSDAFEDSRRGAVRVVAVHGESGIGKTSLIERFLEQSARLHQVIALCGRCCARETIPHRTLDGIIDALAERLSDKPTEAAPRLPAQHVSALVRLFPVLGRSPFARDATPCTVIDPDELRRQATEALAILLRELPRQGPLVLWVDDLQWGDDDGAAMLGDLLRVAATPILCVVSYRDAEADGTGVEAFLRRAPSVSSVRVGRLTAGTTSHLVDRLLATEAPSLRALAASIARQAGGSPLFAAQLVHYLRAGSRGPQRVTEISLEAAIQARIEGLPTAARIVLDVIALADQPLPRTIARQAARPPHAGRDPFRELQLAHLIRAADAAESGLVQPAHDRIRQAVVAGLASAHRARLHGALARALATWEGADDASVGLHHDRAGEVADALLRYDQAAQQAMSTLAFGRASRLYRRVVDLREAGGQRDAGPWDDLGRALASEGRVDDAAAAYREAALRASSLAERVAHQGHAAQELLHGGRTDEGLALMRDTLEAVGIRAPAGPRSALWHLAWNRLRMRLRGLDFELRAPEQIGPAKRLALEVCLTATTAFTRADAMTGAALQSEHLRRALDLGDARHVAHALALEGAFRSLWAPGRGPRVRPILERAVAIAEQSGDRRTLGTVWTIAGIAATLQGEWRRGRADGERGERILLEVTSGWELSANRVYLFLCLFHGGDLPEIARRVPPMLEDARARGNQASIAALLTGNASVLQLMRDRPDEVLEDAREAQERWPGMATQHVGDLSVVRALLHAGRASAARSALMRRWPALRSAGALRIAFVRYELLALRACALLAAGDHRHAARDGRTLERMAFPGSAAMSACVRAGLASRRGDRACAAAELEGAEEGFSAHEMPLHALLARRHRCALLDLGPCPIAEADHALAGLGVEHPAALTRALIPT